MANKKLGIAPNIPAAAALDGTEKLYAVQGGNSRWPLVSQILTYILGAASLAEFIADVVGALIAAATGTNGGVEVTYDDAGNVERIGLASSAFLALTDAATIAWNMASGYNAKVTLGGNRIQGTPTNPIEGRTYTLQLIQDGTGSRTWTPAASMSFGSVGAPTLSTAAGKIDLVTLLCLESAGPTFRCVFNKSA